MWTFAIQHGCWDLMVNECAFLKTEAFLEKCPHIWRVFHLWLHFITFGGHSAHLSYCVHKSGHKTSIVISQNANTKITHFQKLINKRWNEDASISCNPNDNWCSESCQPYPSEVVVWCCEVTEV